jgi:hypothetical protein
MRLFEKVTLKDDPDPKARSCYRLYMPQQERTWLRSVDGRPVSAIRTRFVEWCCEKLWVARRRCFLSGTTPAGRTSKEARRWIGE